MKKLKFLKKCTRVENRNNPIPIGYNLKRGNEVKNEINAPNVNRNTGNSKGDLGNFITQTYKDSQKKERLFFANSSID